MNDPRTENMMRYGHSSFREMLHEAIKENRYIEDIYGQEINPGDTYYENDCGELIHEENLAQYALDRMELNEKNSLEAATSKRVNENTNTVVVYHKSEVNMTNKFIEQRVDELEKATTEQIEWNRGQIDTNGLVISKLAEVFDKVAKQGEEITELKLIVRQLRGPSTIAEDVIEFEGQQYKRVDREAREGDVVVFKESHASCVTARKAYKAYGHSRLIFRDDEGDGVLVYGGGVAKGTPEIVDVYELIEESKSKIQGITIEIDPPKSANQQRAEIIEKAKKFLEEKGKRFGFSINDNKRILAYNIRTEKVAFARCHPNDVFNADIGKAIALGRAIGLDVSEFENAVQPDEVVVGQTIKWDATSNMYDILNIDGHRYSFYSYALKEEVGMFEYANLKDLATIINDTNAEYEVNA